MTVYLWTLAAAWSICIIGVGTGFVGHFLPLIDSPDDVEDLVERRDLRIKRICQLERRVKWFRVATQLCSVSCVTFVIALVLGMLHITK